MYKVQTLNNISDLGLKRLPLGQYTVDDEVAEPDAILVRSTRMHDMPLSDSLKAIGRAGAGVNNIPLEAMTKRGVAVFNSPGANANAVKELVLAGMLLASRNICQAWDYARNLEGDDASIHKQVEAGKKNYVGVELPGRTLGVVGLGAIGVQVTNAALKLGMNVIGYDPSITVRSAWRLSAEATQAHSIEELLSQVDYVSFHVPLIEATKHMINSERIKLMKDGAVILNFSRDGIVDDAAVCDAIEAGKLYSYVCDYASNTLKRHERVITLPHIGASTGEAEDNCAVMVVDQIRNYLENGNIVNSVNFPEVVMPRSGNTGNSRIAIVNSNVPNMVGQISTAMAEANLNIIDLLNKSRGDIAYTLADVEGDIPVDVIEKIRAIDGVVCVRTL
ncbi:MAG: phosphoglycerate dehydrogenase [Gammaproteobacteria bacterium]|nr:phosphoglycerate dehydrogenase [Gammaproteobacteria bacterium]